MYIHTCAIYNHVSTASCWELVHGKTFFQFRRSLEVGRRAHLRSVRRHASVLGIHIVFEAVFTDVSFLYFLVSVSCKCPQTIFNTHCIQDGVVSRTARLFSGPDGLVWGITVSHPEGFSENGCYFLITTS